MALIAIVDHDNTVIGRKARTDLQSDDIYTAATLWIKDEKGNVLLSQRSFKKKNSPGKWGPSAAGTIEYDESYISNVIKEAKQELGLNISPDDLQKGPLVFHQKSRKYFAQSYIYTYEAKEDDFLLQNDEVVDVKWFDIARVDDLLIKYPEMFSSSFADTWKLVKPYLLSTTILK